LKTFCNAEPFRRAIRNCENLACPHYEPEFRRKDLAFSRELKGIPPLNAALEKKLIDCCEGLSTHTLNTCIKHGLYTLGDLAKFRIFDFSKLNGVGKRTLEEVMGLLERYGLCFSDRYILSMNDTEPQKPKEKPIIADAINEYFAKYELGDVLKTLATSL